VQSPYGAILRPDVPGRYFEQFAVGEIITHEVTRTVTEVDNILFSTMTMNPQPLHIDYEAAAKSIHGRPLVNGMFTLALLVGLTVSDTTLGTTEGNLGFQQVDYLAPVFYGDTLRAETEVLAARPSQSRPDFGIVSFEHRAFNQSGTIVLRARRSALMRRQSARP